MSMYGKNPLQYCKVISLQLIKINENNNNNNNIINNNRGGREIPQVRQIQITLGW